ncbi:MAG TPA: flagellar hook-length control protein FliK [Alcanivorax sp.]|nr:flagellar hook-length control protein FliK [Alcanivorax sp.]
MDITALLSQTLAKTGPAGQPSAANGDAFAGSLQAAANRLLGGEHGEATLALLNASGDHAISGEASDALRNALEALAGSRLKATDGDLATEDTSLAEPTTAGRDNDNAVPSGTDNPVAAGLAMAAPLTTTANRPAPDLPVMRAPDTLNRAVAAAGLPADGAAVDTPAPTNTDAKPATPTWAADAQALAGTLERPRLDTRLAVNPDGGAQNTAVMGATGHVTPAAGSASPSAAFTLQAPVASAPWQQQLGQQMVGLAQRGDQHMELHLNPRELGPLSVSLKLDDQGAQAHFFSSHSTVRGAVEQAIPQLREALAEQGIALGEAMVGEHRQSFAGNGDGQPGERGAAPAGDALADEPAGTDSVPVSRIIGEAGGVDLYA